MTKLTVLRVADEGAIAAKTIKFDGFGKIAKSKFIAGTKFHYSQKEVEGIKELSEYLFELAHDSQTFLIRGELAPWQNPKKTVRRLGVKGNGKDGFFQSSPTGQPWILLDFDGISTPSTINFITNPHQAIEYLVSRLPPYFLGVSYHYHLSSNAGVDGGKTIRAHIWYWLDHPVTDAHLLVWAKSVNCSCDLIDENLFSAVHAHYTADPIFKDVADPFPKNRSGFVKGKTDAVAFPAISIPTFTYSSEVEGLTPTQAFNHYISAVGDHEGGMGFRIPLRQASWYYVLENGVEGTDKTALKQKLKEVIAKADQSKHTPSEINFKASDAFLDGLINGAIAKIGANGKKGKIEGLEPFYQNQVVLSATEAEVELSKLVLSYFENPRNMGIRAAAGLGKTTKVLAKTRGQMWDDKKVEIYVPTHALAKEVAKILKTNPTGKKLPHQTYAPSGCEVQVIGGRNQVTTHGKPYCFKKDVADALAVLRLPIYPNLCRNNSFSCEHYGKCEYIKQFSGEYDVRIFTHAHLGLDRGFLDKDLPDYAVIDESFFKNHLVGTHPKEKPISLSEIKKAPWPNELIAALLLVPVGTPLLSYLRKKLGEDAAIDCIESALSESEKASKLGIIGLDQPDQLDLVTQLKAKSRLDKFLRVLLQEMATGRDECHGIQYQTEDKKQKQTEGYALRYRRPITRFTGKHQGAVVKVPVLAIDADLTPLVHREFFPDAEYHQISTERKCHIVQCYSTKNSKTSLTIDKHAAVRIAEIQTMISRVAEDKNILVLGPQDIVGNPKSNIVPKVSVPEGSALDHFGNIRGIDSYKGMDAVVVVSNNNPPVKGIEATARALWFDSEEPLQIGVVSLMNEPRGYRTSSGYKVGVNVAIHPDPRVQTLLELIREAETLQGLDRLRLVHVSKAKRVFLLSNLVLDLTVNNLLDWPDMIECTTKLNEAWNQLNGVLPLSDHWLAKRFPDLFVSKDAAGGYLTKIGDQLSQLSNSIIIRKSTQLRILSYKVSGQKGPAPKCLSKYEPEETKHHLETLLGKTIISITQVQ